MRRVLVGALAGAVSLVWLTSTPTFAAPDYDGDGFTAADCEPLDPAVHPGALDDPDLTFEDLDCDGVDGTASGAFFVATTGSNGGGTGSKGSPFRTISFAIGQAVAANRDVYVEAGTYTEHVALAGGVSVFGGYLPGGARATNAVTTIAGPGVQPETVLASGVTAVELQLLTITGPTGAGPGGSSYALRATGGSLLALRAVKATGGDAGDGAAGGSGSAGASGSGGRCGGYNAGECEAPNFSQAGGAGGVGAAGGGFTGGNGAGSVLNANGAAGSTGAGPSPGAGGAGGQPFLGGCSSDPNDAAYCGGRNGGVGATGADGTPGTGATFGIDAAGATWLNAAASSGGSIGSVGSSGGGGGSGRSSSASCFSGAGGGGGGSGAGGTAGAGGANGGGSFAVYLSGSSVVVAKGSLVGGAAGDGGAGGSGGLGGTGGSGGAGQAANFAGCYDGGAGGHGGNGGQGGGGGGGAGGLSVGIFATANSNFAVRANVTVAGGAGGTGGSPGAGGSAGGSNSGAVGPSAATLAQAGANSTPVDFDGDGTIDPADACPTEPAGTVNGCPARPAKFVLVKGSLTIAYSEGAGAFKGTKRPVGACAAGELVTVYKKRDGTDLKIGSDRTNAQGNYKVPASGRSGTYYATAPAHREAAAHAYCLDVRSPNLRIPSG